MLRREIPPKISELLPDLDDRLALRNFMANEVPNDGGKVHFALISALSVRRCMVNEISIRDAL